MDLPTGVTNHTLSMRTIVFGKRNLLPGLLLCLICFAAYWPALRNGFVWDDAAVLENMDLKTLDGLRALWLDPDQVEHEGHYWPIVYTSFWVEWNLWGKNPYGYHLDNIFLFAANILLLWSLFRKLNLCGAWVAAACFALHPQHVESVAWIIERKDLLSGLFFLSSCLMFFWSEERGRGWRYVLSLFLFLAALLSKTSAIVLPVGLALCLWWKRGSLSARHWRSLVPFFLIAVIHTCVEFSWFAGRRHFDFGLSFADRILVAGRAVWFYAWKFLWPWNVMPIYPKWEIDSSSLASYLYPLGVFGALEILWIGRRRWGRGPVAAVLFFIVGVGPTLGLIDFSFMGFSYVADRFQYLGGISLTMLIVGGVFHLMRKWPRWGRYAVSFGIACWFALMFQTIWEYIPCFKDNPTLWKSALERDPDCVHANYCLGLEYDRAGDIGKAAQYYRHVLILKPDHEMACTHLGGILVSAGRLDEAIALYQAALKVNPRSTRMENDLGVAYAMKGLYPEALGHFSKALEYSPTDQETLLNLANTHLEIGKTEEAIQNLRRALDSVPDWPPALGRLAWIYATSKEDRFRDAKEALRLAEISCQATRNQDPVMLDVLAAAFAEAGQFEQAALKAQEALPLARAKNADLAGEIHKRLTLYNERRPFRR